MSSNTFNVKDYGAVNDGSTVCTDAVQACIDVCHENGGGYVYLADGTYVCGTLYLKSNVFLYLAASAVLLASPHIEDYGADTHYNRYVNEKEMDRCFLYAEDAKHIGIMGEGMIDGNAEMFPNEGSSLRPMMLRFLRCRNIRLQGISMVQAAAWTTAFLDSEDIWIEDLDICNDKRYNGDGLDFDGCRNVFVTRCKIKGTDDNLCLQAGSKEYPVENVHISDCHFTSICAAVRIGLKSVGDIRGVTVTGCTFERVWREGIKIECTEGGTISDIVVTGNVMRNVTRPVFLLLNNRLAEIGSSVGLKRMPEIGKLERILIDGLTVTDDEEMQNIHYRFQDDIMGSPRFGGIRVDANQNHKISQLTLQNVTYTAIGGVKKEEIPVEYPEVPDWCGEDEENWDMTAGASENYYPDWSRTAFMDIRNVEGLILNQVVLKLLHPDEREAYLIEGCSCMKQEIFLLASYLEERKRT